MFVAYNKDLLYMCVQQRFAIHVVCVCVCVCVFVCVTTFCQSRIKSVCWDDCVFRCKTVPLSGWLPVFVATQCLHFQGWWVLYFKGRGFMFLWYVHTCLPNLIVSDCGTPQCAFSLPWDVTSQIDEFIQQKPGEIVCLLHCDLSSNDRQMHLIGMRSKKHRPCFVAEWHCGQNEAGYWKIQNLVLHHKQKKGRVGVGGGVLMCHVLFNMPFMSDSVLPVDCILGDFCKLLFRF